MECLSWIDNDKYQLTARIQPLTGWFWVALAFLGVAGALFILLPSTRAKILSVVRGEASSAEVDRLLSAHRAVLEDNFTLCIGRSYVVLVNRPPLSRDMQVIYRGSHQEPAERGWDYSHHFEADDGSLLVLPIEKAPRTVADSLLFFADIEHPEAGTWRNPSLMQGLYHRAKRIRELSAADVTEGVVGIEEAVPRLFELALIGGDNNPFIAALQRVAAEALPFLSSLDDSVASDLKPASERILAMLGSEKHIAEYREALWSADPIELRKAVKRVAQIGDPLSELRLQELKQHSNMSVRFAVRDALAKLAQSESNLT